MGKSSTQKAAEQSDLAIQQQQLALQRQQIAQQQQSFQMFQNANKQLAPFDTQMLGIGQQSAAGNAPSALTAGPLAQLAQGGQQNRQDLMNFFGQSGQINGSGANSGILAGPMANIGNQQALGAAQINQQGILQGLGIGFQGANNILGQASVLNPTGFANAASTAGNAGTLNPQQFANPWVGALGGALGGLGSAAGGALSNPNVKL